MNKKEIKISWLQFSLSIFIAIVLAIATFFGGIAYEKHNSNNLNSNLKIAPIKYEVGCLEGKYEDFPLKVSNYAKKHAYMVLVGIVKSSSNEINISLISEELRDLEEENILSFVKGEEPYFINFINPQTSEVTRQKILFYSIDAGQTKNIYMRVEGIKCNTPSTTLFFNIDQFEENLGSLQVFGED